MIKNEGEYKVCNLKELEFFLNESEKQIECVDVIGDVSNESEIGDFIFYKVFYITYYN